MQPKLQQIEIQSVCGDDDDFTVDDRPGRELLEECVVKLGKVAIERPEVAALNVDVGLAAEDDRPEAVPFGLVQEAAAGWQRRRRASRALARLAEGSGTLEVVSR